MCNLTKPINLPQITGYKRVAKLGDKYFSLAMGFEYKKGMKIPELTLKDAPEMPSWSSFYPPNILLNPDSNVHSPELKGRTAVFLHLGDAERFRHSGEHIVRMTISGGLIKGTYGSTFFEAEVVAGRKIIKIEEILSCYKYSHQSI